MPVSFLIFIGSMAWYFNRVQQIVHMKYQKVSEYDQELPQSHTADKPTAP